MSSDLNRIFLTGRLTADPDVKYTPSGSEVAQFTLAVNRAYKTKDSDEWKEEAFFVRVVSWVKLAEKVEKNFKKGDLVLVEGRLNIRTYEIDGVKKWSTEIIANNIKFLPRNKPRNEEYAGKDNNTNSGTNVPFS